jgi:hypothetical protein
VGAPKRDDSHRLFTAYGSLQQGCYFGVNLPPAHVAVLSRRHLGVPELIGADPRGQARVVDHRGHRGGGSLRLAKPRALGLGASSQPTPKHDRQHDDHHCCYGCPNPFNGFAA